MKLSPQPKCDRYWPARVGASERHGDFKIVCVGHAPPPIPCANFPIESLTPSCANTEGGAESGHMPQEGICARGEGVTSIVLIPRPHGFNRTIV